MSDRNKGRLVVGVILLFVAFIIFNQSSPHDRPNSNAGAISPRMIAYISMGAGIVMVLAALLTSQKASLSTASPAEQRDENGRRTLARDLGRIFAKLIGRK